MSAAKKTHKLTVTAMLSAVAFLLMFIEFPIPALIPSFVKMDISDLPELLAAFSLGPVYGVAVTFFKNLLFALIHGTSSAYVGEMFNFISGAVFSFTAGFIYQRFIFKHAGEHMSWIFTGIAIIYLLAFLLMCFFVKEGEYPPPEPKKNNMIVTYFRDCFSVPFYRWFFLAMACTEASMI